MMRLVFMTTVIMTFALRSALAQAESSAPAEIFASPIAIERQASVTHIPISLSGGKLRIEATVDGQPREFLFDTGSPTVLAKHFADTLNLEIIGRNVGSDSHGNVVTMEIAVVDRLTLGDVTFRRVPVLIHDFSDNDMGRCMIGNGLIGSEIFPASVWRIDTQTNRLSIAATAGDLPAPASKPLRTGLYDTGYPHAPIIEYSVGDLTDKAMFDTGNSAKISFFKPAADHPSIRKAVVAGTLVRGEGYEGESAGGLSESGSLTRFEIGKISFASGQLGATESIVRAMPPTLFGAGLLRDYIITLDYPGKQMLLEKRTRPEAARHDPGYGIAMIDGRAVVVRLFAGSAAERAGLKLGDHVIAAQGRSLTQLDGPGYCDTVKWLVTEFDTHEAATVIVQREDGPHQFNLPAAN